MPRSPDRPHVRTRRCGLAAQRRRVRSIPLWRPHAGPAREVEADATPVLDAAAPVSEQFLAERWDFVGSREDDERGTVCVEGQQIRLSRMGTLSVKPSTMGASAGRGRIPSRPKSRTCPGSRLPVGTLLPCIPPIGTSGFGGRRTSRNRRTGSGPSRGGRSRRVDGGRCPRRSEAHADPVGQRPPGGRRRFYTWDTERQEIPIGSWTVTTGDQPVPFDRPCPPAGIRPDGHRRGGPDASPRL